MKRSYFAILLEEGLSQPATPRHGTRMKNSNKDETHEMVALFRALSDPSRLGLVKLLASGPRHTSDNGCGVEALCVNALARQLSITQSAVSQHLRVLRNIGLVRGMRRGPFVHYSVDLDGLDQTLQALRDSLGIGRYKR